MDLKGYAQECLGSVSRFNVLLRTFMKICRVVMHPKIFLVEANGMVMHSESQVCACRAYRSAYKGECHCICRHSGRSLKVIKVLLAHHTTAPFLNNLPVV